VRILSLAVLIAALGVACAPWDDYQHPPHPPPGCVLYKPPATAETWELAVRVREDGCMVRMLAPVPPTNRL